MGWAEIKREVGRDFVVDEFELGLLFGGNLQGRVHDVESMEEKELR